MQNNFEIKASEVKSSAKSMLDCKSGLCLQSPSKDAPMGVISAY